MVTKHHPTPEERDERLSIHLPADKAIKMILDADVRDEQETDDANEGDDT